MIIDDEPALCMVPFADMLNHRSPKQTDWKYDEKRQGFVIQSRENIQKGMEVCDHYGDINNFASFLAYGFVGPPSERDLVSVELELNKDDSEFK